MNFAVISQEVVLVAVRSRGPGGQNVNKVSSAAQLFWYYLESAGLSADEKHRVGLKLTNLINKEGQIYLRADEFRDLERNRSRALEKLEAHLREALHRPKARRATKPTRGSIERRHKGKSTRGDLKQKRRRVDWSGD
jgi:ribosome-associated protein